VVKGRIRRGLEHGLAVGYGFTYEDIVASVPAYRALLDEIVGFAARSLPAGKDRRSAQVLDVASGIGTLAFRLAEEGYNVVGLEGVKYLVELARERRQARNVRNTAFHHVTVGVDPLPAPGTFDFAVGLHVLYWHPRPDRALDATRAALKPGGHALFVNFTRPVRVIAVFRAVLARDGLRRAYQALRWLVPTAIFERLREYEPHYTDPDQLEALLTQAGFDLLETRHTFLADISVLGWVRRPR
jgi:SAM-dependent methyltransferase